MFDSYGQQDPRKWTVLVDPEGMSIWITCYENQNLGEIKFKIDDGGQVFTNNYFLITSSIEVVVSKLLSVGVQQRED